MAEVSLSKFELRRTSLLIEQLAIFSDMSGTRSISWHATCRRRRGLVVVTTCRPVGSVTTSGRFSTFRASGCSTTRMTRTCFSWQVLLRRCWASRSCKCFVFQPAVLRCQEVVSSTSMTSSVVQCCAMHHTQHCVHEQPRVLHRGFMAASYKSTLDGSKLGIAWSCLMVLLMCMLAGKSTRCSHKYVSHVYGTSVMSQKCSSLSRLSSWRCAV